MSDPVTGPISREKLRELATAPFGEALKEIRKHDPLYWIREDEPIKWRVRATRVVPQEGYAEISADSIENARLYAEKLSESDFLWETLASDIDSLEIEDVEPRI